MIEKTKSASTLSVQDVAQIALEDVKGIDIRLIDVRPMTSVVDHMLIATGTSTRQVKALANNVMVECKKAGFAPLSSEGEQSGDWILVDFGDLAVHVMLPETREFYDLERLWMHSPSKRENDSGS